MLLSLVLLLLTTLFLLLSPCDWGKETQDRVTPTTLNKPLGTFRAPGTKTGTEPLHCRVNRSVGSSQQNREILISCWYTVTRLLSNPLKKKKLHFFFIGENPVWLFCWNCSLLEVKYEQKQQLVSRQVYSETIWTQQVAFGSIFSKDSNHKFAFAVVLLQAATQPKDVRQSHKLYLKKSL